MIRAFKDTNRNYYVKTEKGIDYYSAIRIPQATENRTLKTLAQEGKFSQEDFLQRERIALDTIRAFDNGEAEVEETLSSLMNYSGPLLLGKMILLKNIKKRNRLEESYRRTLETKPWKKCGVQFVQKLEWRLLFFGVPTVMTKRFIIWKFILYVKLMVIEMINKYEFQGVFAQQSESHTVVSFPAKQKISLK